MTSVVLRIEGIGYPIRSTQRPSNVSLAGMIAWCSEVPRYAPPGSEFWQPSLFQLPDQLSEKIDPLGGVVELGDLNFGIVEHRDGRVASLFRCAPVPEVRLSSALTSSATSFTLSDVTWVTTNSLCWIGEECLYISGLSGSTLTVERAYAGTSARAHAAGEPVFSVSPFIVGRTVYGYYVPPDATSYTDEQPFGVWIIDSMSWSHHLQVWQFSARSLVAMLQRVAPHNPITFRTTTSLDIGCSTVGFDIFRNNSTWDGDSDSISSNGTYSNFYLMHVDTKEIFSVWGSSIVSYESQISRRRMGPDGAQVPADSKIESGSLLKIIFVAEQYTDDGSFSVAGSSETSNHPIDILLTIMTSSLDESADGYVSNGNGDGTYGDWATLPSGYGLGIPAGKIDYASFMDVKARTYNKQLSWFAYGTETKPFFELANQLLKPIGAFLYVNNSGKIACCLTRTPTTEEDVTEITVDDLVGEPTASIDQVLEGGSLILKTMDGGDILIASSFFQNTYARRGLYQVESSKTEINLPNHMASQWGWLDNLAARIFFHWAFPITSIRIETEHEPDEISVGQIVSVTIPDLPNLRTGARGAVQDYFVVLSKSISFDQGQTCTMELQRYLDRKVGVIAPSANITSVATNTATCTANRYTCSNALNGLPTKDVSAFEVGDICKLTDRSGALATGALETITSINSGSNQITFGGNFGGALAANLIIEIANLTAANPRINRCAWIGDDTGDVNSLKDADVWGEM